jgi:nitrate reductase gamma subunit
MVDYSAMVWVHTLISLVFLAFIPFSKTWHAFVSPVEIALDASERTPLGESYGGATH